MADNSDNQDKNSEDEKGKKILKTIKEGWGEAITILVGAIVFVTAFAWRDLFQLCIEKIKQRSPSSFSPILVAFLLAVALTIGSIVLIRTTGFKKRKMPDKN